MELSLYHRIKIIHDELKKEGKQININNLVVGSLFHHSGTINEHEAKAFIKLIKNFQIYLNNSNDKFISINVNNLFTIKSQNNRYYLTSYLEYNEEKITLLCAFKDFRDIDEDFKQLIFNNLSKEVDFNI